MANPAHRLAAILVAALSLTGCGVTLEQSALQRGIFAHTNRDFDGSADADQPGLPHTIKLRDLDASPRAAFHGQLSSAGARPRKSGQVDVTRLETLDDDAFHAKGARKQQLLASGELEPGMRTFGEAIEGADSVVVFVHGFNNNAIAAAEKAILLDREFQARGDKVVLLFYTWPTTQNYLQVAVGGALQKVSLGRIDMVLNDAYLGDRKNVDLAASDLYGLLSEIAETYPKLKIDIVGHSLGSEVVLKSFLLWHYNHLIHENQAARLRGIRRVALVGADVGVDTFRLLSKPSGVVTEQLLVYLNPRDDILGTSAELNDALRIGAQELKEPFPDIQGPINFVELRDPLFPKGRRWVRSLLVNHNPLEDRRILEHVCRFIATGQVEEEMDSITVKRITGGAFDRTETKYYRLRFPNGNGFVDSAADAIQTLTNPRRWLSQTAKSPPEPPDSN